MLRVISTAIMQALIGAVAISSMACSDSKSVAATSVSMSVSDVKHVLESLVDLDEKSIFAGAENRFLIQLTAGEYDAFVHRFCLQLKKHGEEHYDYRASASSSTGYDDKLSFFSVRLGRIPENRVDITVVGSYHATNQRLLIRVFRSDLGPE